MVAKRPRSLKETLIRRRKELAAHISKLVKHAAVRPARAAGDMGDHASRSLEGETVGTLVEVSARELRQIDEALEKLEAKKYGICERCKGKIPAARLKALPSARFCLACQRKEELESRGDFDNIPLRTPREVRGEPPGELWE